MVKIATKEKSVSFSPSYWRKKCFIPTVLFEQYVVRMKPKQCPIKSVMNPMIATAIVAESWNQIPLDCDNNTGYLFSHLSQKQAWDPIQDH